MISKIYYFLMELIFYKKYMGYRVNTRIGNCNRNIGWIWDSVDGDCGPIYDLIKKHSIKEVRGIVSRGIMERFMMGNPVFAIKRVRSKFSIKQIEVAYEKTKI